MTTEPLTNQQVVDEIEALLGRAKEMSCAIYGYTDSHPKDCRGGCGGTGTITDPRLQAAWELVTIITLPGIPVWVEEWPDGAVRGLLEQVVDTLWPENPMPKALWGEGVPSGFVSAHFCWGGDVPDFGKAIMGALNEQR